ncbi:MAG TPA: hypothetical protein VMG34_00890 [Bacteroidota bacterium]|nr:hypothetical protein [Bacteroidota bacterium]
MNRSDYNLLLRSFTAPLSDDEHRTLEAALASSGELRACREELKELRTILPPKEQASFKPFFAERVEERLRSGGSPIDSRYFLAFRPIAAAAAILVILLSAYNLSRSGVLSVESAFGYSYPSLPQVLTLEAPLE